MKIRDALVTAAAMALLTATVGAGSAAAQTVVPHTGAAPCTTDTLKQTTLYHGDICYANTGDDDVSSSGFWTTKIFTGCYEGFVEFYDAHGKWARQGFRALHTLPYDEYPSHAVSLTRVHIDKVTC